MASLMAAAQGATLYLCEREALWQGGGPSWIQKAVCLLGGGGIAGDQGGRQGAGEEASAPSRVEMVAAGHRAGWLESGVAEYVG